VSAGFLIAALLGKDVALGNSDRSADFLNGAREQTRDVVSRVRDRAEKVKDEQPLQVLAVVAGIAVIFGW
jgi:hypothetical protein